MSGPVPAPALPAPAFPAPTFPAGACDTHIHVYDRRRPAAPGALLNPPDASFADYAAVRRELGLERVVVVQPTTYGLDNRVQLDALAASGIDGRAVVVIDDTTPLAEIGRLHDRGARGDRFHQLPGGALTWAMMPAVAARVAAFGWHVQLQTNGHDLAERVDDLLALAVPVVVDHVGRFMPPAPPGSVAADALFRLVDSGRAWVKLSAPYESSRDGAPVYPVVSDLARALVRRAPERMLWGSNWPHPGQPAATDPATLRTLAFDWMPDPVARRRILVDNPAALYGFPLISDPDEPSSSNPSEHP